MESSWPLVAVRAYRREKIALPPSAQSATPGLSIRVVLLFAAERLGIATADDVDIDSLFDRMAREVVAGVSLFVGHFQVLAWSRT